MTTAILTDTLKGKVSFSPSAASAQTDNPALLATAHAARAVSEVRFQAQVGASLPLPPVQSSVADTLRGTVRIPVNDRGGITVRFQAPIPAANQPIEEVRGSIAIPSDNQDTVRGTVALPSNRADLDSLRGKVVLPSNPSPEIRGAVSIASGNRDEVRGSVSIPSSDLAETVRFQAAVPSESADSVRFQAEVPDSNEKLKQFVKDRGLIFMNLINAIGRYIYLADAKLDEVEIAWKEYVDTKDLSEMPEVAQVPSDAHTQRYDDFVRTTITPSDSKTNTQFMKLIVHPHLEKIWGRHCLANENIFPYKPTDGA
jgi:hypothetical protein